MRYASMCEYVKTWPNRKKKYIFLYSVIYFLKYPEKLNEVLTYSKFKDKELDKCLNALGKVKNWVSLLDIPNEKSTI